MIDCKVCCKICEQTLCRHAGTQRGLEVDCRYYTPRQKPQTNADRIRAMRDEELADFIQNIRTNTLLAEALGVPVSREKDLELVRQPVKDGDSDGV